MAPLLCGRLPGERARNLIAATASTSRMTAERQTTSTSRPRRVAFFIALSSSVGVGELPRIKSELPGDSFCLANALAGLVKLQTLLNLAGHFILAALAIQLDRLVGRLNRLLKLP